MEHGSLIFKLGDGSERRIALDQPSIALGRDAANDLVLDDPSVAPRHALVAVDEGGVTIMDLASTAGTYLDHRRLSPNVLVSIQPGARLALGEVGGVYEGPLETAKLDSVAELALSVSPPPVRPGGTTEARVRVRNAGTAEETFDLYEEDVPSSWVTISPTSVTLAPGDAETVTVLFRLPQDADERAGAQTFRVVARERARPNRHGEVASELVILGRDHLDLGLEPPEGEGPFEVTLHNGGRESRVYSLTAETEDDGVPLDFHLKPSMLAVAAGAEAVARLEVSPERRPWLGRERGVPFAVLATPDEPSALPTRASGAFRLAPRIPWWAWLVLLALLAGVGLFLLLRGSAGCGFGLGDCGPAPTVSFSASPAEIQPGGDALLSWYVEGASEIEIEPGIGPVSNQGTQRVVPTESTTYTLRAVSAEGAVTETTTTVAVIGNEPRVERFEAQPPVIVVGRDAALTLLWQVVGAETVEIEGVEGSLPGAGSLETQAPAQTTTYLLRARNGWGEAEAELTVSVIEQGCVVASVGGQPVPVYEGPSAFHRQLGTLPAGQAVEPIGRDSGGGWLLLSQTGRDVWIAAEDVSCAVPLDYPTVDPGAIPPAPLTATFTPSATLPPSATAPPTATSLPTATDLPTATSAPPTATILPPPTVPPTVPPTGQPTLVPRPTPAATETPGAGPTETIEAPAPPALPAASTRAPSP